ncbi:MULTISPECIES: LysR family transcriptional regulator [Mesorhizobium]|uniref:LysR family transcriptional regulator n=1 Tax=Mesorhizobium TaxID=68287 RepID=UPI0007ED4192|nr:MULTISPECIES: LysR family transcriptional regulator [Mesorhizobium]PBB51906.1 LysR family transcriptional regulator [Mesorhizobium loti]QIA25251.1 LysR family transcriptional regulator [Mesorhizobium sp. AA22]
MSDALDKITLRQLQIFLAVVEHKSFVGAASQLNLTPPAVSMQMSRLSDVLDAPLFDRDGRSIQLTPAATALIPYAERMTEALNEAINVIDGLQGRLDRLVRVAMVMTSRNFGPHLLKEFSRLHQDIQIETTIANREKVIELLQSGNVDLALMGRPPQRIEVEAVPFASHPYVLIGHPDHVLASKQHISRRELTAFKFIAREAGSGTRMIHDYYFTSHSVQLPPLYVVMDSNENIKQAVMADMGLAFISGHTIALECQAKKLRILHAEDMPAMREWFAVHLKGRQLRPAAESFKAFVVNEGPSFMRRFFGNLPKELLRA